MRVKRKTKQFPKHGHGSAGSPVIFVIFLILFPPKFLIRFRFQILAGTRKDFFLRSVFVADEKTKATGQYQRKRQMLKGSADIVLFSFDAFLLLLIIIAHDTFAFSSSAKFASSSSSSSFSTGLVVDSTSTSLGMSSSSSSTPIESMSSAVSQALGRDVVLVFSSGGGGSGGGGATTSTLVDKQSGDKYFCKAARHKLDMLMSEYIGVQEIADTNTIQVPTPIAFGQHEKTGQAFCIFEYLEFCGGGKGNQFELGAKLAKVRRETASKMLILQGWKGLG